MKLTLVSIHLLLPNHSTYRFVISNLLHSTLHTKIITALTKLEHSYKNIYNIKNKNKWPFPLFFVDIRPQ